VVTPNRGRALAHRERLVGERAGLPLHRFALEDTAAAHSAVENGAAGKVLIAVAPASASEPEA
jgi:hypothetical protein